MTHRWRGAVVVFLVLGVSLSAAEITFSGYTSGCFGTCTVVDSGGILQTQSFDVGVGNPILNFANADLSGATSGGIFNLNASGSALSLNTNNLGGMDQFAIGTGTAINTTFSTDGNVHRAILGNAHLRRRGDRP